MKFSKRDVESMVESSLNPNWCEVSQIYEHGCQTGYSVIVYDQEGNKKHLSIMIDVIVTDC